MDRVQLEGWVVLWEVWNFLNVENWVMGKNIDAPPNGQ